MRPSKSSIPMENWSAGQLQKVITSKKSTPEAKEKVQKILTERQEKGWNLLCNFFSQEKNKFWNLAKWQVYREGKAKIYGVGIHRRFYIKDPTLIFDKMIELRTKFGKYEKGKDSIIKEFNEWKR